VLPISWGSRRGLSEEEEEEKKKKEVHSAGRSAQSLTHTHSTQFDWAKVLKWLISR